MVGCGEGGEGAERGDLALEGKEVWFKKLWFKKSKGKVEEGSRLQTEMCC